MSRTKFTRNVGENRGKKRVWIEGVNLAKHGWVKGVRYNQMIKGGSMFLSKNEGGSKKVAGTETRPILDLCGNYMNDIVDGFEIVNVIVTDHNIKIVGGVA